MEGLFQIGDFVFRILYPAEAAPPENFMKFKIGPEDGTQGRISRLEYTYRLRMEESLPEPAGTVIARRPDLAVFQDGPLESRLIGVKGRKNFYACYRETGENEAEITLDRAETAQLHIDPVYTSLFALERRLVKKENLVLHCAYVEYRGEAILFSAPSETGKTTQANLWEKYRKARTVNGDRALLGTRNGRWCAQGWPVCGTSEVCHKEAFPIRAVVMLSQAKENQGERMTPGKAFPLLYAQITANKWNPADHIHTMDLIENFLGQVPVIHLACSISQGAVACLEEILQNLDA